MASRKALWLSLSLGSVDTTKNIFKLSKRRDGLLPLLKGGICFKNKSKKPKDLSNSSLSPLLLAAGPTPFLSQLPGLLHVSQGWGGGP